MSTMITRLKAWLHDNKSLISNSGSLIGTAVANAGLGFVYWWIAARLYEERVVGLASAYISAMMLLGSIAMLGLGTLLVGELSKRKGEEPELVTTSLITIVIAAITVAVMFVLVAVGFGYEFDALGNPVNFLIFVLGTVLTAVTLMLDQAFIGMLRGGVQFSRNMVAAVVKLVAIALFGLWLTDINGMWIFSAWVIGLVLSTVVPYRFLIAEFGMQVRLKWSFLQELGKSALTHHWLNLTLDAPIRTMPVLVTVVLSPEINASFAIAWMIAGLMFFPVQSLTLVLYAVGSQDSSVLAEKARLTLRLSALVAIVGYIGMFIVAGFILGIFGESYAATASTSLRIVTLAAFPLIIKDHFVAIQRINDNAIFAAKIVTFGASLEIVMAVIGAMMGGLNMLSVGWVLAITLQAIYMLPMVYRTATGRKQKTA